MESKDTPSIEQIVNSSASDIVNYLNSLNQIDQNLFVSRICNNFYRNPEISLKVMFSILQELSESSGDKNLTILCINQLKETSIKCTNFQPEFFNNFCSGNYLCIDPECLKHFFDTFNYPYSEDNLISYIMYLIVCDLPIKAVKLMKDFELTDKILNKFDIIHYLTSKNKLESVYSIIKKDEKNARHLVMCLCKFKKIQEAEDYIRQFNFNPQDFPIYQIKTKKWSLKHFIFKDKTNIFNLIELLENDVYGLAALIELLLKVYEKNGIWMLKIANSLIEHNQHIIEYISPEIVQLINLSKRYLLIPPDDKLAPVITNCCGLPQNIVVKFVSSLNDIESIEWENNSVVGIDSEWRTTVGGKFEKSKNSILQIANGNIVYLIDLMISENRKDLDKKLYELFGNSSICKVGVALDGDMQKLKESHPDFHCFKSPLKCYLDLINVHKRHYKTDPGGLANLCEIHLGYSICKSEQKSNWELRPLRKSQKHYAALDAFICLVIYSNFLENSILIESDLISELKEADKRYTGSLPPHKKTCDICNSRLHEPTHCPKITKCDFCGFVGHQVNDCPCIIENPS